MVWSINYQRHHHSTIHIEARSFDRNAVTETYIAMSKTRRNVVGLNNIRVFVSRIVIFNFFEKYRDSKNPWRIFLLKILPRIRSLIYIYALQVFNQKHMKIWSTIPLSLSSEVIVIFYFIRNPLGNSQMISQYNTLFLKEGPQRDQCSSCRSYIMRLLGAFQRCCQIKCI